MDLLRAAVGDERLTYLGFSYGTFLGATYAALFPDRYRALVLDGALAPEEYLTDPVSLSTAQAAGFERALDRFAEACAVDPPPPVPASAAPTHCWPTTGCWRPPRRRPSRPRVTPRTAPGHRGRDPRGDPDPALRQAAVGAARRSTGRCGGRGRLGDPSTGRPGRVRRPRVDRPVFAISAGEQQWPTDVDAYLERGAAEWAAFPHFWGGFAYSEIPWGLWPVQDEDAFTGPYELPGTSATPLVIGTTYDPATPYSGSVAMVEALGNARLLTMEGDGHTAYGGNSACIDSVTDAYLVDGALPAAGTVCQQEVPVVAPTDVPVEASTATQRLAVPLAG